MSLVIDDLKPGTGTTAAVGDSVEVHYTGWLTSGTKFDSSKDRDQPFNFKLGQKMVIRGWDEGVVGMKVGGVRKLTIPADMAYGSRGAGGVIPPNAVLVFEVELLKVNGRVNGGFPGDRCSSLEAIRMHPPTDTGTSLRVPGSVRIDSTENGVKTIRHSEACSSELDALEPVAAAMEQERGQQSRGTAVAVEIGMDRGELIIDEACRGRRRRPLLFKDAFVLRTSCRMKGATSFASGGM